MTVAEYTKHLLSIEEYSFSLDEVLDNTSKHITAVRRELSRLIEKKEIVNLRRGFYLIIPPRYSKIGKLPLALYVHKLFAYLNRDYYIGLYSAAKIHGASHQQIHGDYIIIETPKLNTVRKKNLLLQFHTTVHWPRNNIVKKRSDAGAYKVASPELTFIDLIHYQSKLGGINRMMASLEELTEAFSEHDLEALLAWYEHKSTLQRAGFLLEEILGSNRYSDLIFDRLKREPFYPTLLSPENDNKPGSTDNRWKIDLNLVLESDL